jgi:putative tricarboxylic transport membrane protein
MARRNTIAAIVLMLIGIGYGVLTTHLPTREIDQTTEPSFFPGVVAVCLLVLSAVLLFQGIRADADSRRPAAFGPAVGAGRYVAGLAAFLVYLALLPALGFLAANVLFFAVLMVVYGERRPTWLAIGSLGVSLVLFFLFRELFQIRLPAGILAPWIT